MLKRTIFGIGALSSSLLIINSSTNLTQYSVKNDEAIALHNYYPMHISNTKPEKKTQLTAQEKGWIAQAQKVNEKLEEKKLNSKKQFTRGLDEVRVSGILEVWVTKAYLGNVATILGAVGGGIALALGVLALILTAIGVAALLTGGIGLILMPIIGVLYGTAVAVVMNKINNYDYGGYFKADLSLIATPITIMASLREQDRYESAPRLIDLDESIKFPHKKSYDLLLNDRSKGLTRSFWKMDQEDHIGVIDITKYNADLTHHFVQKVIANIGLRNADGDEFKFQNNYKLQKFLADYYQDKDNDYLFWVIEKSPKDEYVVKIGGEQWINGISQKKSWSSITLDSSTKITDLAIDLVLFLQEN